jgi:hypothetical protein
MLRFKTPKKILAEEINRVDKITENMKSTLKLVDPINSADRFF